MLFNTIYIRGPSSLENKPTPPPPLPHYPLSIEDPLHKKLAQHVNTPATPPIYN